MWGDFGPHIFIFNQSICSFKLNSDIKEIIDKVQESNNRIMMMKCINYDSLMQTTQLAAANLDDPNEFKRTFCAHG